MHRPSRPTTLIVIALLAMAMFATPALSGIPHETMPAGPDDQAAVEMPCHAAPADSGNADPDCPHCGEHGARIFCHCCDLAFSPGILASLQAGLVQPAPPPARVHMRLALPRPPADNLYRPPISPNR